MSKSLNGSSDQREFGCIVGVGDGVEVGVGVGFGGSSGSAVGAGVGTGVGGTVGEGLRRGVGVGIVELVLSPEFGLYPKAKPDITNAAASITGRAFVNIITSVL